MRAFTILLALCIAAVAQTPTHTEYKLLATKRTSTMEKELNEAAAAGYRLFGTIGGEVANGEIVTVMKKNFDPSERYSYRVLATNKTSTMEKELNEAGEQGFNYRGETARGEVILLLELDRSAEKHSRFQYRLLATNKTSTMEKELNEAAAQGFEFMGVIRRAEVISILRKEPR
jgi:hypothetical protein